MRPLKCIILDKTFHVSSVNINPGMKVRFVVILANSIIPYLYAAYFLYRKDQHALMWKQEKAFSPEFYTVLDEWLSHQK
jgi:hypothetical protein